jgi:hypothetical protein
MNSQFIITVIICLTLVLPVVGFIVHRIDQNDKRKLNAGAALFVKRNRRQPLYQAYISLSRCTLTRNYIYKISRRYELLYPGDVRMIAAKTMNVVLISALFCSLEFFMIYLMKPNLHNGVLSVILAIIIHNEIVNSQAGNAEIRLLEQMVIFVSNVRHNYHINRLVDDAILSSSEGLDYEMKVHANKLYEIITSNHLREEVAKYNATSNNKYLKMFLSLCINVIEYSDRKVNGQLLFTSNLEHLKREINIEILKLKKLKYVFSGTIFVTIAVCVPVDAIQSFGISLVPDLENFYTGRGGILFICAIFLSSVIVYLLINNLKEINQHINTDHWFLIKMERLGFIKKALDNYTEKNYGKVLVVKDVLIRIGERISPRQFLLKRMIYASITFFFCIGLVLFMHHRNQYNLSQKVTNIDSIVNVNSQKQKEMFAETIIRYVRKYKDEDINETEILERLSKDNVFTNRKINEAISAEVYDRIHLYRAEFIHWYELAACFAAAGAAYFLPYLMLLYKKRILKMNMEDEVNQFNSIIYMLMFIDHMTVKGLLEQLELFAGVFKQSIRECINEYNSGELEALTRMKEKETYGPFQRLVDNLIRCDTISIEKAFDEIISDRENYYDRRKLENEVSIQKRADVAKPLSFIPAILVTAYLLLPLMIASLKELEGFKESLSSMGF